jgi:hypothetical protein
MVATPSTPHGAGQRGFFAQQLDEIRSDRALTLYGAALAGANVLTFVQWKFRTGVPLMIGRGADSFCWPFFEDCHAFQLPVFFVNYGLWGYLLLSLIAGYWFLKRNVAPAYWMLVLVDVIRVLVMFQDYRLRANQHYMLNWIVLAYLFLPGKRALTHHILVSLYFWAGILKLDWDWLSGAALYSQERLWFPAWLVPASCVYVVILETLMIWGLYARRNWIFYGTLAQLVLFHVTSWSIVGFWYPTLMFCLLSILPLTRLLHPPGEWITFPWRERGTRRLVTACVLGTFGVLQMVPRAFPGDTSITGEGRVFALHMFDALVECDASITHHLAGGGTREQVLQETKRLPHRSRCDPLIYFNIARNQCAHIAANDTSRLEGVVDLDLSLRSKRNSATEYQQIIDIRKFCAADPSYDVWRHNPWIRLTSP